MILTNPYQDIITDELIQSLPQEVQDQFLDFIYNVPFISRLISPSRKKAKDLAKDDKEKIIVDITNPHILEDMDYFRPSAIHFEKYGCYTFLRPNPNPNSEFYIWIKEERRRCIEGYIRESDGEWITGDHYFFLNYCPIQISVEDPNSKNAAIRTVGFPKVWDGHYLLFHYLYQARENGKHALMLASRGKGKSFSGAALLAKRFILGENDIAKHKVQCMVTAAGKQFITGGNQILDMFQYYIDYCAENTQWPRRRITSSLNDMRWVMGYKEADTDIRKGTENTVMGITSKDDISKLRGSRGVLYIIEEAGSFPNLISLYSVLRPSVEDGPNVFGLIYGYGTSGDSESDFYSMQEMMYSPNGFNLLALENVFDKHNQGRKEFTFFFPSYLNRARAYDKDGNSNVVKAIIEILLDRYNTKYGSSDTNTLTRRIAEYPIVPQEAIVSIKASIFPTTDIIARINQIDSNPREYDDVAYGNLVIGLGGVIEFIPSAEHFPIRDFPHKDNKIEGAIEFFKMPEKGSDGKPLSRRYIMSIDPYENDQADTMSLGSIFVMDTFTDSLVAEYTGRPLYADDFYEKARRLALFYNARINYENNKKGLFAYFAKHNCLFLLEDTLEFLKDRDLIKVNGFGNTAKGVNATAAINAYARELIKNWLISPVTILSDDLDEEGNQIETTVSKVYTIRNRALLKELASWNHQGNFDRVSSLGMLMLYREDRKIKGGFGEVIEDEETDKNYLGNDAFFSGGTVRKIIRRKV